MVLIINALASCETGYIQFITSCKQAKEEEMKRRVAVKEMLPISLNFCDGNGVFKLNAK